MNIEQVVSNMLNGEPVHDGLVIGIIFVCFNVFYNTIFGGLFTIFRK